MLYSLPTLTIATRYGVHKSTVHRWAKREGWASIPHTGKGAGDDWLIHSLPKDRQRFLNKAHAKETVQASVLNSVAEVVSKQSSKSAPIQSLSGISERGQRKTEAKKLIVSAIKRACEASPETAPSVIKENFVVLYRLRKAPVPDGVYEIIKSISRGSIDNWIKREEKEGVRGLAKNYAPRAARNYIDTTPKLKEFLVGMIEERPHVKAVALREAALARFGVYGSAPDPDVKIPSERRMQAWLKKWKLDNEQLYQHMLNPDAWRSAHKLAMGNASAHVVALNQEWQADSTVCDLMLNDGQRHTIVAMIDVYSRRVRFHVSRTSSAAAVASCFRKALLDWGVPDTLKTDNGSDYVSNHMKRIIAFLNIEHDICPPFTPEHKPHVERVFKTFLHQHVELMQGYIGHNVAQRKDIEARKSFADRLFKKLKTEEARVELAVSPEELQRVCDTWAEVKYGNTVHGSLDGQTPSQKAAAYTGTVYRIEDERALDVLLLPCPGNNGIRTVTKEGIRLTRKLSGFSMGGYYISADFGPLEGRKVLVRMDDADLGRIQIYDPETHEYLGKAEHPGLLGMTAEQVRQISINGVRKQKAFINNARKQSKAAAKAADVKDIANEILDAALREHEAQPVNTTPEQTVAFVNSSLEQAARSVTGDFTPPTEAEHEAAMARLTNSEPKPKAFVVPENPSAKMDFWQDIYDRCITGGIAFGEDERRWFYSYAKSQICQAHCTLHGINLPNFTDGNATKNPLH